MNEPTPDTDKLTALSREERQIVHEQEILLSAIGNTPILFWVCPAGCRGIVRWSHLVGGGNQATCEVCQQTSPVFLPVRPRKEAFPASEHPVLCSKRVLLSQLVAVAMQVLHHDASDCEETTWELNQLSERFSALLAAAEFPQETAVRLLAAELKGNPEYFCNILRDYQTILQKVCAYAEQEAKPRGVPAWAIIKKITGHGSGVSAAIYELYREKGSPDAE